MELARTLAAAIRARVAERRNNCLCVGTLLYLSNPNITAIDDTFNMPKNAPIWHLIQTLLLLITQIIRNLLLRRPLKALILQLHRQQTEMLMLMEGGTLPDLEGAVRRVTINDEDRPAGSAIRCREDHDKRHQG